MAVRYILFDFDGTLIDSSPSILQCMMAALDDAGITPVRDVNSTLIGPPLMQTLASLTGLDDPCVLEQLATGFKSQYDTCGYKATVVYPGIDVLLRELRRMSIPLGIATNKRYNPTVKIIEHLGWTDYFSVVGAQDGPGGPFASKAELIASLLTTHGICPDVSYYVGDKREDGEAADANGLSFLAAVWGYGDWSNDCPQGWTLTQSPGHMTSFFRGVL